MKKRQGSYYSIRCNEISSLGLFLWLMELTGVQGHGHKTFCDGGNGLVAMFKTIIVIKKRSFFCLFCAQHDGNDAIGSEPGGLW